MTTTGVSTTIDGYVNVLWWLEQYGGRIGIVGAVPDGCYQAFSRRLSDGVCRRPEMFLFSQEVDDPGLWMASRDDDGGRRILKRITENTEIEVEQGEYLTPHGGRRRTGEVMVRGHGFAAAARLLDDSEKMVRERYSHIDAGEMADVASDVFAEVDIEGNGEIPDSYR
jgi:hypothetical protein